MCETMRARRRKFSRSGAVYFLVLSGLVYGGSAWLDDRGEMVAATVTGKLEEVQVSDAPQGGWERWYRLGVEFPTPDKGLGQATVTVPLKRFDGIRRGDTIRVRYLPSFPLLARTVDRSTASVVMDAVTRLGTDGFLLPFLLWLGGGLLMLWIAARVATLAVFAAGLAWGIAALLVAFPEPAPLTAGSARATARVEAVKLVAKSPTVRQSRRRRIVSGDGIRRLAVPYEVLQLRFAVPGRADSVLAVDAVDASSVPGIAVGAEVQVQYDPASPREALLSGAERTFRERNRYHLRVPILGLALICTLGAWGWSARRGRV